MMAKTLFTREQVVQLLDSDDSDAEGLQDDRLDDVFFPGSDDDLGFLEELAEDENCVLQNSVTENYLS